MPRKGQILRLFLLWIVSWTMRTPRNQDRLPESEDQSEGVLLGTSSWRLESNRPLNDSTQRLPSFVASVRFVRDTMSFGCGFAAL